MRSSREIEALVIESLNQAVEAGYLLIRGDWGVCWDADRLLWVGDVEASGIAGCDIQAAICLSDQDWSAEHASQHGGDVVRAVCGLLDPEFFSAPKELEDLLCAKAHVYARNLANGWDGLGYLGDNEGAYLLGQKLSAIYQPVEVALTRQVNSEIRIIVPKDADSVESFEYQTLTG